MSKFAGLAIEVERPSRMIIRHPATGRPLVAKDDPDCVAYIDVFSADSEVARSHHRKHGQERMDALARHGKISRQIEEIEASDTDLLAALTAGWNLLNLNGEKLPVEYSKDNARELYREPAMAWLREQVDRFSAERGNFLKASANN